jgi:hypothetical protein
MTEAEEKANAIYASSRKHLDESLAAARPHFEAAGIAISDESEHHHRLWSVKFIKPVHGSFGQATVQIWLIYGQIPFMEAPVPIGLGYAAIVPNRDQTYSGQGQLEFAEIHAKGLFTVVSEAIDQTVQAIVA